MTMQSDTLQGRIAIVTGAASPIGMGRAITAALVRAAVSRTREFQADATGAHNCGNPLALASALQKLERGAEARPMKVAEGASHLFIVNPLRGVNFASLFSTHPPTAERVQRLTSMDIRPKF